MFCLIACASLSAARPFVGAVRRVALQLGVMDSPNSRGSHVTANPRAGGIALVTLVLLASTMLGTILAPACIVPLFIVAHLVGAGKPEY